MVDTMSEKNADIMAGLVIREGVNGRRTYSVAAKRAQDAACKTFALENIGQSEIDVGA
jgi:hypothetical protein